MTESKKDARRAGVLYLAYIITCIFAGVVRSRLIVLGDASKTADLLRNSLWLLRISFVDDLASAEHLVDLGVGGFCLYRGSATEVAAMAAMMGALVGVLHGDH